MDTKVRKVRCPRCRSVLKEPSDVPVYECGGCGIKLQAKKRNNSAVDTTSQRPGDDSLGKQKAGQVFVDQEAASSSHQQSMLNSTNESDQNSDHNDQDATKMAENGKVDAPASVVEECSSEKLKIKQFSDNQEPCCSSSNQQSMHNSTDESDQNSDHNDIRSSNKDQDAAKIPENGTVDAPPSVVEEHSSEKLKIKQLSDYQEPCGSSNQQSLVNSSNEPDQNIRNDPRSSTEFSGHEDPESSPEATSHNIIDQERKQQQDQSHYQENGTATAKQKIEQLSDDTETGSSLTHLLLVNSMNELDRNNDLNEHLSSSELSYHDDPESSPEATAHNIIDQEQEQEQNQKHDQSHYQKQQENVTVIGLEHSSGKQKIEQLFDDTETGSSFRQLLLVNSMNELDRINDLNEHLSSSELSYHEDPEPWTEDTIHNRGKRHETEFVSCRNETEIEESSSEFEEAIANTSIISDSDGGSKPSFRSMIADKLLVTRQKKPVYLDEDDLLSEDESADLRHRRRFGRIRSEESMETARFDGTGYYEYEGSVSSFDGNDNQNPRKHHIGSIRDEHVDSGHRYRFNRRKDEHRSMDVRSIYGLNEFHKNPRHHRSPMIPENPNLERIKLLKLVRELQDQLERKNVSHLQQARYGQRMAFSGEATAVNRRRDGGSCHHCCPQDRHFSSQLPRHHDCCNGLNYRPNTYHSPRFSGPSSPKHNHSVHSESDFSAPFRSPKKKQYVRPIAGGSPWIACYLCSKLLQLPQSFLLFNRRYHSLRCGACFKILNFTLSNGTHVSRYYPEEMIAAPPSSEVEDFDTLTGPWAGPVSCSDRSFEKSYSTETHRNCSREFSDERRKGTMSRGPSGSTRPPSSKISGRRMATSEIEEVEPRPNGSPLHWLMGYASPSKVIRGL
ncbi:hypothetical protein L1987_35346 [Smallanthus sonchifolius]|uniref:Uncharacterized protein n=1 Tax=Smallanthus sonchifolius TaxID=185202 RepID=A0ACB9HW69_9ASTR|nr:hypothetical protein L1987_35346 [Smallanthus sonchifolius]